jgi:hypothetical protein
MTMRTFAIIMFSLVALATAVKPSHADDACLTFFWTGSNRALVDRYKPHYLVGQGLEDVNMGHIIGTRIRYKWSTQAASCIASTNRYGYFFHPDFELTSCLPTEDCNPGVRRKRMSERLADVLDVAEQLGTPNADSTYQLNLNRARTSSYLVVDAMENAVTSTASFYGQLVGVYNTMIDQLALVLNLAFPPSLRTAVMDQLCSPQNVAQLEDLVDQCLNQDSFCELAFLFITINNCENYQSGATLDQLFTSLTAARDGLVVERTELASERDQIQSLWNQIQALRP